MLFFASIVSYPLRKAVAYINGRNRNEIRPAARPQGGRCRPLFVVRVQTRRPIRPRLRSARSGSGNWQQDRGISAVVLADGLGDCNQGKSACRRQVSMTLASSVTAGESCGRVRCPSPLPSARQVVVVVAAREVVDDDDVGPEGGQPQERSPPRTMILLRWS